MFVAANLVVGLVVATAVVVVVVVLALVAGTLLMMSSFGVVVVLLEMSDFMVFEFVRFSGTFALLREGSMVASMLETAAGVAEFVDCTGPSLVVVVILSGAAVVSLVSSDFFS